MKKLLLSTLFLLSLSASAYQATTVECIFDLPIDTAETVYEKNSIVIHEISNGVAKGSMFDSDSKTFSLNCYTEGQDFICEMFDSYGEYPDREGIVRINVGKNGKASKVELDFFYYEDSSGEFPATCF